MEHGIDSKLTGNFLVDKMIRQVFPAKEVNCTTISAALDKAKPKEYKNKDTLTNSKRFATLE